MKIGKHLALALRMKLAEIFVECTDIFAWSSSDMGIICRHIAEHKLGIPKGINLVFQKKRAFAKARQRVNKKRSKNYSQPGLSN